MTSISGASYRVTSDLLTEQCPRGARQEGQAKEPSISPGQHVVSSVRCLLTRKSCETRGRHRPANSAMGGAASPPYASNFAVNVIFVLYSLDTGHPAFAACTALSKASWLLPEFSPPDPDDSL